MFLDKGNYLLLKEWKDLGVKAIYTKQNFGNIKEMKKESILKNVSLEGKSVISGHQTHSDNIEIIDNLDNLYFENTDGFITDREDVVILTKYADCLPIYFMDIKKGVIGVVHSGWQGSYKEIGKKAIYLMQKRYDSSLNDIKVAFGIGISQVRYEVGKEFLEKFQEKFSKKLIEKSFRMEKDKMYFDNQSFVYHNLKEIGLEDSNILTNNLCTYDGKFHSYRRDKDKSGRNGALIWLDR